MDFIDRIQALANRIPKQLDSIQTEEATKTALIMPFIGALGYDVFNPSEVIPEFTADVGTKKGEKVDYAVFQDGKLVMIFECKFHGDDLNDAHRSQLYRYFSVTESRIAVLTNGIVYQFYSDLESPNQMDSRPFLVFDLLDIQEPLIGELKKLSKDAFNLEEIISTASELMYTRALKKVLSDQIANPTDDFVKYFASQVYSGNITQAVREQFTNIVKGAFTQFIGEKINERLKSAMQNEEVPVAEEEPPEDSNIEEKGVVTTDEEIEGYHIVKAILRETIDPSRVVMRDTKSYCGILLDDNNRKTICRFHFNSTKKKYIGLFSNKNEERVSIENLNQIFSHSDRIKATVNEYDQVNSDKGLDSN